jgi:hypothetical protein
MSQCRSWALKYSHPGVVAILIALDLRGHSRTVMAWSRRFKTAPACKFRFMVAIPFDEAFRVQLSGPQ